MSNEPVKKPARKFKRSRGHPARIHAQERAIRAVELRKAGSTYRQIAQVLGYADEHSAWVSVQRVLERIPVEPVDDLRTLQLERLNHMILPLWPKVQAGDERAIDTALRVMMRIDQLRGTEEPAQINVQHSHEVIVIEGERDNYIDRMKMMAGAIEASVQEPPALPA